MKELSIEEKARRYDEAIEKAKSKIRDDKDHVLYEDDVKEIFPELKGLDLEDERIRTFLHHTFTAQYLCKDKLGKWHGEPVVNILAWLEKQGEPKEINPSEFDSQLNSLLKKFESIPKEDLAGILNFYLNVVRNDGTYKEEKQGEQKSIKVPKFKVGDFIQFKGIGHTRYTVKEVCDLSHYINTCNKRMDMSYTDANFELVEQKPTDKVVPKFKVGDIIRLKGAVAEYTINKVTDTTYYTNGWSCGIERCEEDYELVEQKPTEWSEIEPIIQHLDNLGNTAMADILRSFEPQPQWKPSEKQIMALRWVLHHMLYDSRKEEINGLLEQLLKLYNYGENR